MIIELIVKILIGIVDSLVSIIPPISIDIPDLTPLRQIVEGGSYFFHIDAFNATVATIITAFFLVYGKGLVMFILTKIPFLNIK